jgi:hypothetical protein
MSADPWWRPLGELSVPAWRPPGPAASDSRGAGQGEPAGEAWAAWAQDIAWKSRQPTQRLVALVADFFRADQVRLWSLASLPQALRLQAVQPAADAVPRHRRAASSAKDRWRGEAMASGWPDELQRLLQVAADQRQPLWVEPAPLLTTIKPPMESHASAGRGRETFRAPRMLVALARQRSATYIVEILLPEDRNRLSARDRELYLSGLARLGSLFQAADQQCCDKLRRQLERQRRSMARLIDRWLIEFTDRTFETLVEKQKMVTELHEILDSHGFRLACPICGEPAILRCLVSGNSPSGSFVFDHYLADGRTFHGGRTELPRLHVLPKPARKRLVHRRS